MDDKLRGSLKIEGRTYPIFIPKKNEEVYRRARLNLQKRIAQYRTRFSKDVSLDTQDFMAMAAFQFSLDNLYLAEEKDIDTFTDKIRQLTNEIDKYLQEK